MILRSRVAWWVEFRLRLVCFVLCMGCYFWWVSWVWICLWQDLVHDGVFWVSCMFFGGFLTELLWSLFCVET